MQKYLQSIVLGSSGLKVSKVGLGALQASGKKWRSELRDKEVASAIKKSIELGINFIDTAESYGGGHSEEVIGKVAKEFGRDNLVIATKVNGRHLRYFELQKACNASLERLGLKVIDLYQIHWPDPWEQIPFSKTFRAMEKLYNEGKIRAIGVSNFAVRDLKEARSLLSRTEIVSNQLRYNLVQREIEQEVLPYCNRNRITTIAWSPLAQGLLGEKYSLNGAKPRDKLRAEYPLFNDENLNKMKELFDLLKSLSAHHKKTIAQVALNWLVSKPNVVPIPGATTRKQAEENAGSVGWELENKESGHLAKVLETVKLAYFP